MLHVALEELAVVQVREEIAVQNEEVLGKVRDETHRTSGPERPVLSRVIDVDAEPRAVAEVGLDDVREVADRHRDSRAAVVPELPDDDFEERMIAERQERLRDRDGVRREARPLLPGEDHRAHHFTSAPRVPSATARGCVDKRRGSPAP